MLYRRRFLRRYPAFDLCHTLRTIYRSHTNAKCLQSSYAPTGWGSIKERIKFFTEDRLTAVKRLPRPSITLPKSASPTTAVGTLPVLLFRFRFDATYVVKRHKQVLPHETHDFRLNRSEVRCIFDTTHRYGCVLDSITSPTTLPTRPLIRNGWHSEFKKPKFRLESFNA